MESADSIGSLRSQYKILDQGTSLWDVSNGLAVIFFMIIIFSILFYGISSISNISKIKKNWSEYRCDPSIMPFATLYGFDAAENFQFCMGKVFEQHSGDYTSSFTTMLRGVTGVLGTLLGSLNSMRLAIATMGGGINVIFQEFVDRIRQFFFRIRVSAIQIRQLMFRLYASFFAVIYIGMSSITGMQNLGNTALFKFLDTFCFDPTTKINIANRGYIPIELVEIGDTILPANEKVTAKFQFFADGQPMVILPREDVEESGQIAIKVSTNHYISHEGKWIQVADHPSVLATFDWKGGKSHPLICLNTDKNTITFSTSRVFADYDETSIGDYQTMKNLQDQMNARPRELKDSLSGQEYDSLYSFSEYSPALSPSTKIKLDNQTSIPIKSINLCDKLSTHSRVVGIVHKLVTEWCWLGDQRISASTLVWNPEKLQWQRAGEFLVIRTSIEPEIFIGLFVEHSSQIELANGIFVRDYIEVFSPDSEKVYSEALNIQSVATSESEQ